MDEQDKAVALAERIKTCVHHGLPEQWVLNLLADHRQQVIEELANKAGVMPPVFDGGVCFEDAVAEAIATMQAKVEQANRMFDRLNQIAGENERKLEQAQARVAELEKERGDLQELFRRAPFDSYCIQIDFGDWHNRRFFTNYDRKMVGRIAESMLHELEAAAMKGQQS